MVSVSVNETVLGSGVAAGALSNWSVVEPFKMPPPVMAPVVVLGLVSVGGGVAGGRL
jgi:hypothetical protein